MKKKNPWKTIAIASIGVASASVVIIFKLLTELEEVTGAFEATTDMLKEMADDGEIENLTIGGKPYNVED